MSDGTPGSRLDEERLVDPAVERAYDAFLRQAPSGANDPYYAEERVRFEMRDDDVLVTPGDLGVSVASCGVRFQSVRLQGGVDVCGVSMSEASALPAAIDGRRTAREIREASGVRDETWQRFTAATFGVLVFAPRAVEALERGVSGVEIVRYPGSPYEIVRAYWQNMGAVASRLTALPSVLGDTTRFVRFLRELHGLALLGDGTSFYRPASRIADSGKVEPTRFLSEGARIEKTPGGARILSGARVNASSIGGEQYQTLLAESLGDPESLAPSREYAEDGLDWGRVVTSRAATDDDEKPWFCPPRPLRERHFDVLRSNLARAGGAEAGSPELVESLARFHQCFVRLHPFRCGNQSLAMSVVNHCLRPVLGAGMSHLVLDHLALRLSSDAYTGAFDTAVRAWVVTGGPVARYAEIAGRKRRAFAFIRALSETPSVDRARSLVVENTENARLVLLDGVRRGKSSL